MRSESTDTVIIGAGPAGLAMSKHLGDRRIDHVLIERGAVAQRWRSERWDSLRLLTPNWQTRLPGHRYTGDDPDGYMTMPEVVAYFTDYARSIDAPVHENTTVTSVATTALGGYQVTTDQGSWTAPTVVLATGACGRPIIPEAAAALPDGLLQLAPKDYRNPDQLPEGAVLVVGASASGLQLAEEVHASGRPVTLAVGRHARMPRTYRGMDIQWWLDSIGTLDLRYDEVSDLAARRTAPSSQLIGTPEHRSLDLGALAGQGVRLAGRLIGAGPDHVDFADDLAVTTADADARLAKLLDRIDSWIDERGAAPEMLAPDRPAPLVVAGGPTRLGLAESRLSTVVWATGYRPHMPWLDVAVIGDDGQLAHDGGVTSAPGLYALGLPFMRRRKSTFIDGFGVDAADIASHLSRHLAESAKDSRGASHAR